MRIKAYREKSYFFRIFLLSRTLEKNLERNLREYSLSIVQALCLIAIFSEENDSILLRDLTTVFGFQKSLISHSIAKLESDGYLKRSILPKDKRRFKLSITDKTKRLAPKLIRIFDRNDNNFEKSLDLLDKNVLNKLFKGILA
jgi:DNA-binding MarR family transcriptional regulator